METGGILEASAGGDGYGRYVAALPSHRRLSLKTILTYLKQHPDPNEDYVLKPLERLFAESGAVVKHMAHGAQRDFVVRLGDYVVKDNVLPAWHKEYETDTIEDMRRLTTGQPRSFARTLRKFGICRPRQWFVGKWVVQPVYTAKDPYSPKRSAWDIEKIDTTAHETMYSRNGARAYYTPTGQFAGKLDLHAGNLGLNRAGKVVAFDL